MESRVWRTSLGDHRSNWALPVHAVFSVILAWDTDVPVEDIKNAMQKVCLRLRSAARRALLPLLQCAQESPLLGAAHVV